MNRALPEMTNCLNTPGNLAATANGKDMSVLERQRARVQWQREPVQQQQQQRQHFIHGNEFTMFPIPTPSQPRQFQDLVNKSHSGGFSDLVVRAVKPDQGLENGWTDFGIFGGESLGIGPCGIGHGTGFDINYGISRTASCLPAVAEVVAVDAMKKEPVPPEKLSSAVGRESFKKRKADKNQNLKVVMENDSKEKKMKACSEDGESKITEQNSDTDNKNTNKETSADKSNVSEAPKTDYIHVRARRGQATDSHSLAERVRREKISERMRYLQDLVPGCNKITGKAGMLDEIINYVQSLQRQVEFLSMKLAAVNPTLDFNIDNFFTKEVFPTCTSNFPTIGVSPEIANPSYVQFNPSQIVSCAGMEMGMISAPDIDLPRTIGAPVSVPETILDSSFLDAIPSELETDLQSLYAVEFPQAGRSTSFPCLQFTGPSEASNLKTEM